MNAAGSIRAALMTAPVPGAIAVVRILGAGAWSAIAAHVQRPQGNPVRDIVVQRPTLVFIVDGGERVDEALVVRRIAAGIDDIELCLHGGVGVTQRVLGLLRTCGVNVTRADELPSRTLIHPIESDVDRALLACESRRLTQFLLAQRNILPAFLDGMGQMTDADRRAYDNRTRVAIKLVAGLRVVLVGPPNAGKSTLANALIGRDRVITADQPGTTRDWVSETALIVGWPVTLTDTAGIRETTDAIEVEAIRRGREQAGLADLVVVLVDATRPLAEANGAISSIKSDDIAKVPRIIAINKCDAAQAETITAIRNEWSQAIVISARQQIGLKELNQAIVSQLGLNRLNPAAPTGFLTSHLIPH